MKSTGGIVYLVGAGPGDPGLLTLKGQKCLASADVVVYDSLVNPVILRETRPGADLIYVGKRAKSHLMEQEAINALLVEKGKAGLNVVRLKGGDPFLFARGGEEAEALADAGVAFEIVPGVPSPTAALAYAGIPLTHRKFTSSLAIVTAHEAIDKPMWPVDWQKLATSAGTIVFLMCWGKIKEITANLIKHGRSPETPSAVIQWGTRPEQRTVVGTLADITGKMEAASLIPPAVMVVGEVVRLRSKLNWYEMKPLFGHRIVVTRTRKQASELSDLIEFFGGEALSVPTIDINAPPEPEAFKNALKELSSYDWVVFTSVNAVDSVFDSLAEIGMDARSFHGVKLCAIGPATAERLRSFKLLVDLIPKGYKSESIIEEFEKLGEIKGLRVLLPRADIAPPLLPDGLSSMGAEPVEVVAYRTVIADPPSQNTLQRLLNGEASFVTFTSSSTVENFVQLLGQENLARLPTSLRFASIGPSTSATARKHGLELSVEADEHTIPGLVESLIDFVNGEQSSG